jgi:hypothetical protein
MTIGTSLFVIAIGAIMRFALHVHVAGVNVHTAGVILMVVGAVGLVLGLFLTFRARPAGPPSPPVGY